MLARLLLAVALAPCGAAQTEGASSGTLRVLPGRIDGVAPKDMTHRLLRAEAAERFVEWRNQHDALTTPGQIRERQRDLRRRFVAALGGLPPRTPLRARVVGEVHRPTYRVEKVVLESQPGFLVTAAAFLPLRERHPPPWPGVLVPCGHSESGKGSEPYQKACALLATNGLAALVFDPVDQGERVQLLDETGRVVMWGTQAHTHAGVGCILLGRNTATYEIWDGMRCLDWLAARPDIDPDRLGCMGNSGGGTQTAYLVALDDRIAAASPSCYITNLYERILDLGPQDAEQNIFGQLAWHMDHADYLTMRAPAPVLICAATRDFFDIRGTWASFRAAKRLFGRLGHPERVDLVEHDATHGYAQPLREAAVRWMLRWLAGRDEDVREPRDLPVLSDAEIRCTAQGQVMREPGARSIYDLNRAELERLERARRAVWDAASPAERRSLVRAACGIRRSAEIAELTAEDHGRVRHRGIDLQRVDLVDGRGLHLPALLAQPTPGETPKATPVIVVDDRGKAAAFASDGIAARMLAAGHPVCAVDLRGSGETRQSGQRYHRGQGDDGIDVYMAYLLGESYVGLRAEDLVAAARWWAAKERAESVDVVARGAVGVPALHAAFVEPALIARLRTERTLVSWRSVLECRRIRDQLQNAVHGALRVYDLPDLRDGVDTADPVDAAGMPVR